MSIGLQWSDMFYAEFIAPPKPGIKDKKHLFRLPINGKFMVKKQGTLPSEVYSSTAGEIGHATPSGRSVRHFVFFWHRLDSFFYWATGQPIITHEPDLWLYITRIRVMNPSCQYNTYPNWKRVFYHTNTRVSMPTNSSRRHGVCVRMSFIQTWDGTWTNVLIRPLAVCSCCYLHRGG